MKIRLAVLLVSSLLIGNAIARERYPGQYAQIDPEIRRWFNDQLIPGSSQRCCSEADGVFAEEDIRDGHFWVKFVANTVENGEVNSGWMLVPDAAVIWSGNKHGAPVVWWGWGQSGGLTIRCFAPGAKV